MGVVGGGPVLALQKSQGPLSRTLGNSPAEHSSRTPLLGTPPALGNPALARTAPGALREQTDCYPPALCWPLLHQQARLCTLAVPFLSGWFDSLVHPAPPRKASPGLSKLLGSEPPLKTFGCLVGLSPGGSISAPRDPTSLWIYALKLLPGPTDTAPPPISLPCPRLVGRPVFPFQISP